MVPTLRPPAAPHRTNFYVSSFRQLSELQQRQVGLLLGSAVADAAAASSAFSPSAQTVHVWRRHSFTYVLQSCLVRAMTQTRGPPLVRALQAEWSAAAHTHAAPFRALHATLPHASAVLLPLTALYPFADDDAFAACAEPFAAFLAHGAAEEAALRRTSIAIAGNALRCLRHAPVPSYAPTQDAPPLAEVVKEAMDIARGARGFADGVKEAVGIGGAVSARSLIAGAMLGARFGVRQIPSEWISAMEDHSLVATRAIDIAQWSWNPPR